MKFVRTYPHWLYPARKRNLNLACSCGSLGYLDKRDLSHGEHKDLYCKDFAAGLPN